MYPQTDKWNGKYLRVWHGLGNLIFLLVVVKCEPVYFFSMKGVKSDRVNKCGWWDRRGCNALTSVLKVQCPWWREITDVTITYKKRKVLNLELSLLTPSPPTHTHTGASQLRSGTETYRVNLSSGKALQCTVLELQEKVYTSGHRSGSPKEQSSWLIWAYSPSILK